MGALALRPCRRVVAERLMDGAQQNLSCSSAGAEPQPVLYEDGISTMLG